MLGDIFKRLNIPEDKVADLIAAVKTNPMQALSMIHELGVDQNEMHKIMNELMENPEALNEVMNEAGISMDDVNNAKNNL